MPVSKSPLRYPGGKSKLYKYVKELISKNFDDRPVYVEPYSGGFGIGIELLLNNDVERVIINDYDYAIYCVWKCITSQKLHNQFIEMIASVNISIDEWNIQKNIYLNQDNHSMLEVGFATFYLNRTNRSGIIRANPIGGIEQTGDYKLDCRFNKKRLIELINQIYSQRKRIEVLNLDAIKLLELIDKENTNLFINLDPPYVNAGPTLYTNFYKHSDHAKLSKVIKNLNNKWILTYDDDTLIEDLYSDMNFLRYNLKYSADKKRTGTELLVFSNRVHNIDNYTNYINI